MARKKIAKKKAVKKTVDAESASFEESYSRLEKIVDDLEGGDLTLAESLAKYEEGIRNLKVCHQLLESAESRISLLTGMNRDGTPVTQSFDELPTEMDQRGAKRTYRPSRQTSEDIQSLGTDSSLESDDPSLF